MCTCVRECKNDSNKNGDDDDDELASAFASHLDVTARGVRGKNFWDKAGNWDPTKNRHISGRTDLVADGEK